MINQFLFKMNSKLINKSKFRTYILLLLNHSAISQLVMHYVYQYHWIVPTLDAKHTDKYSIKCSILTPQDIHVFHFIRSHALDIENARIMLNDRKQMPYKKKMPQARKSAIK